MNVPMNLPLNIPKNVTEILPAGMLNNIIPGGAQGLNIAKNPLGAVNDILPTGMLNNLIPGGTGGVISIVLDSPSNCFYAGTVVSGKIIVQMEKAESIRSLSLKIKGAAHVTWNETESERKTMDSSSPQNATSSTENVTTSYSSEEEYFSNKFNILGETEVSAGTQTYQFSSPLPPMLPSSFTGEYGGVKYTVKATMDRAWKLDQSSELEFKVVTPMDLNHNAVAKEPANKEVSKHFCCLFCQSGPLTLSASLPFTGYVAGQVINVNVEADNASNVQIDSVLVKLNKTISWICHKPQRREKNTNTELAKVKMEGVNPHGSKTWSQQIVLPADMPYTNIDACSLIKMKHILEVIGEVSGCHQNLHLEIPLIIGSVPIQTGGGNAMFNNMSPNSDFGGGQLSSGGYPVLPSAPPDASQPLLGPESIGFNLPPANNYQQ